ncbi:MAG: E2/UBC family protein [Gammaproteobacteria bacterium]
MSHSIQVFIDGKNHSFDNPDQFGRTLKQRAGISLERPLWLQKQERHGHDGRDDRACEHGHHDGFARIDNDECVHLQANQHFWSVLPIQHGISVTINLKSFEFTDAHQTGRSLKERADISLGDVLFRDRPKEDEVIADDTKVILECGDHFHSAPPADYGALDIGVRDVGFDHFDSVPQPDGWTFLVVHDYPLPPGLDPVAVELLVKLPPAFPDAAPDMFWLSPHIRTPLGVEPQGTSVETVLGASWQRFSWHLKPGAWRPGVSTLRDFLRCVRTRLEKRN